MDVRGKLVVPGLIDIHSHAGRDKEGPALSLADGVTGFVDAGSQGAERIGADGAVVTPLADREIDALIAALRAERVEALAVALMFSFLNPDHERQLGARLRAALPGLPIYLSCEVLPEIKDGQMTIPDGPGWGTELDEKTARAHPWEG